MLLAPLLTGTYVSELISGVATAADAVGARLIVIQTLDSGVEGGDKPAIQRSTLPGGGEHERSGWPEGAEALVPQFTPRAAWDQVAGFLVVLNAVEPWYLRALREAGKHVVILNAEVEGFPCPVVRPDNRTGIIKAVSHLVGHGHRRIAFAGSIPQLDIRERLDAYRDALASNGLDVDDDLFFAATDNLEEGGEAAGRSMLAAGMPSTAVVVATDYNALGMMRVLREAGLILPRDQAIVGFDDVDEGSSVRPTLSTVHASHQDAGRTATNLLLDMLRGREVAAGPRLIPTVFVPRESCGCTAASTVGGLDTADELLPRSPRDRLRLRLERKLLGWDPPTVRQAAALDNAVDLIVRCVAPPAAEPSSDGFHEAAQALSFIGPHSTAIAATMACLREYGRELRAAPGGDGYSQVRVERCITELAVELSESLARAEVGARTALRRSVSLGHRLSISLLSSDEGGSRSLGWLSHTTARAGCLGLWPTGYATGERDMGRLDIVGSYARDGGQLRLPSQARIEEFPPDALLEDLQWEAGEIAVVLPVKTQSMDMGLLALMTPADPAQIKNYELFEEGALLSVSIEREVMTERLQRSNADLATFSHAMAHDLRNPLATIAMWASVAQMRAGPGEEAAPVRRVVEQIKEVAEYADELVSDLLHYAELDRKATSPEPVDLNLAVARVIATIGSSIAERGALIETGKLPTVPGRPMELDLVLQNLIENAIKYRGERRPRIRLDAVREGDAWKIRCRDNGQGIANDAREQVFEPFTRGLTSVPGSGLGLATCRRIVDAHGGHIWIAASGNVGTTVAFTLPAGPEPEASDGEAPEPDGGTEATTHQRGGHHRQSRHAA